VNWPGELRFLGLRRACIVIDLSCAGAHVQVDGLPRGVRDVRLILEMGPPIAASLVWRRKDRLGLCFDREQDWIAELGRRRLDSAEWLR
jgi:hypothetical protein